MKINIAGIGVWARGLTSYDELVSTVQNGALAGPEEFPAPKPEAIPAKERRRAGLMINLAVTAAHQACEHAGVDKTQVPSVFASCMGDTDITDYMCRKLAQPEKLLSPTKFHNSVHNAPSGYWTLSAENRAPSSFVGGGAHSFGLGLLEAASTALASEVPVLLIAYDIANTQPFADIFSVSESFACAIVVTSPAAHASSLCTVDISTGSGLAVDQPANGALRELAAANPSAQSLAFLEALVQVQESGQDKLNVCISAGETLQLHTSLEAH